MDMHNWMLFDLANDPAEITDLAATHPEIVARLVDEFDQEAGANYVYPIDLRDERRGLQLPPYELDRVLLPREFFRAGQSIPSVVVTPLMADRSYVLTARFDWQPGNDGIIFALGDRFFGLVLFVEDAALHCIYQQWHNPKTLKPVPLSAGAQHFEFDYRATGARKGHASVSLNGTRHLEGVDLSPTLMRIPSCGMSIGVSRRLAVSERYEHRGAFEYGGQIDVAPAEDHPLGLVLHLGKVLQVDPVEPALEQPDHLHGPLARPQVVAEVGTGADTGVVLFHCVQDVDRLVVAMRGPVVVDRDPDIELLHEFVEAREGIGVWIGAKRLDAGGLCEFEHLPVGRGIFAEAVHAVGREREAEVCEFLFHGVDRGGVGVERIHAGIELDEREAQVAGVLERLVHLVVAERIELQAQVQVVGWGCTGQATQRREGRQRRQCESAGRCGDE
jgi:hypothetical protein